MNKQRLLARLATFYLVSCKSANSEKADSMVIPQTDIPTSTEIEIKSEVIEAKIPRYTRRSADYTDASRSNRLGKLQHPRGSNYT